MKTTNAYKWVDLRLREAARTIKLLPLDRHDLPDGVKSGWPSYARDVRFAFGYDGDPTATKEERSHRQAQRNERVIAIQHARVDRMLEVLDWMLWLEPDERTITWRRAEGQSWNEIKDYRSIRTLQRIRDRALGAILIRLYG